VKKIISLRYEENQKNRLANEEDNNIIGAFPNEIVRTIKKSVSKNSFTSDNDDCLPSFSSLNDLASSLRTYMDMIKEALVHLGGEGTTNEIRNYMEHKYGQILLIPKEKLQNKLKVQI